ncbi:TPA: type VI secretion system protein TssA [Vibrio parahaemolyticus]|nr:type VI secretion system protein TssA [Vibrio parahaemolyticus]HBH7854412.1 type VI secretion system protein TssA [Vibrio parahaemolyticus]
MELDNYRNYVAAPISQENPVGQRLLDDPLFEFVEEQMMKVGSLAHGSIQWEQVERTAIQLLGEKTKDIKLLAILLQCLHHDLTPSRWVVSLEVWGDFITHFWTQSYPAPGERGNLPRRKFFSQISQRFLTASKEVNYAQFGEQTKASLALAFSHWQQALEQEQLGQDEITTQLSRSIKQGIEEVQRQVVEKPESNVAPLKASTPLSAPSSVDSSSEKATKETLLKVAGFLSEQDLAIPLSIRLKRFALWGSITSVPDHNTQGETLLRGVPTDRIRDYQEQLSHADLALWRKVEQSLTMAPFWFEGQWMSFQIAERLEQPQWCEAITQECIAFLERLPSLTQLSFKDGRPFVPDEVKAWLLEHQQVGHASLRTVNDWSEKRHEVMALAKEGDVALALTHLNEGLTQATEPRDKGYWRLLIADVLQAEQLDALAQQQYQTLYTQISTMSVSEWEPSLMAQLEREHLSKQ